MPLAKSALLATAIALVPTLAAAEFAACVDDLKADAVARGVAPSIVTAAFEGAERQDDVLRFSTTQPEVVAPIWDYLAFLVDDARIADGRRMLAEHSALLRELEARYGVDRHVLLAIWGVETDYGRERGRHFIPHALATLVCAGERRQAFWRSEVMAALDLVDQGDLTLDELKGSWAGAFGQTQFIPTTYARLAVDFDGDGRRDLVASIPDALASTANYLDRSGWRTDAPWLIEARVPATYTGPTGRREKASLDRWAARGVVRADGSTLRGDRQAGLLLPTGPEGPAFLVFANFDAIHSYNHSERYALAIAHLADRIAGYPALRTAWPTDDPGLSRAERWQLQELLVAAGYDIGGIDGRIGPKTRAAIRAAEEARGLTPSGRAGRRIFDALAADAAGG